MKKDTILNFLYFIRNIRSRALFSALKKYCSGDVLDVGGRDFYLTARNRKIKFSAWTTLDTSKECKPKEVKKNFKFILGDGCKMKLKDNSFDTVINIQVLEHVLEPLKMMSEISRVLKPGGYGILLIPQTCTLHGAPHNYYNFTRYWIIEAMAKNNLEIVELKPIGGIFSSMASHLFYFFLQSIRFPTMSSKECRRNLLFYILYPFMFLYALINIPLCLCLSLGDLSEEPNNHLVIVKK
jgi:ubiquinone/menaquinone biosynthesis C-methylase UbiE